MSESQGSSRNWQEILAKHRPEALEHWTQFSKNFLTLSELPEKFTTLLVFAVDAIDHWPGIRPFCNRAFENGATVQELLDVCMIVGWLKGPHALNYGLTNLDAVIQEREAAGLRTPANKDQL